MKGPKDGVICASINQNLVTTDLVKNQHCCLAISVGQDYHEGIKLETAINLIDKTFAKCTIALGDTLQRHNMMETDNPYQAALQAGDEWLERNRPIFEKLSIPYEIQRWDRWLLQQDFQKQCDLIKTTYEYDPVFRIGFNKTVAIFSERLGKRCTDLDLKKTEQQSINFLLEECAIIMLMWQREKFDYITYPGEMIDALQVTYEKFVKAQQVNILKWVPLQFKRYSPQYLISLKTKTQTIFPAKEFYNQNHIAKAA